jgi:Ca2+-binding EF-hand superfamily protein
MKTSLKWILAASVLTAVGGLAWAGTVIANPGVGHHGGPLHFIALDMLSSIDTNADSALSQEEINAAINSRYTTFDSNKDGQLSLDEFQALWTDLTRPITVRAFQFLDSDGDAAVARAEVDKRFGSLVTQFDGNQDGKLSSEDRRHGRREHGWKRWMPEEPRE